MTLKELLLSVEAAQWAHDNVLVGSRWRNERAARFQDWYDEHYSKPTSSRSNLHYKRAWERYEARFENARWVQPIGAHVADHLASKPRAA